MRFSSWVSFAQVEAAGAKVVVAETEEDPVEAAAEELVTRTTVVVAVEAAIEELVAGTKEDELPETKDTELAPIPQKRMVRSPATFLRSLAFDTTEEGLLFGRQGLLTWLYCWLRSYRC